MNDASKFYPAVGGQSVLLPMQTRTIQGFEFVTPVDDLIAFFPVTNPTPERPLGNPDAGNLDCGDIYLSRFEGPQNLGERTDARQDFSRILGAWSRYAERIGSNRFERGQIPAKTGLAAGEARTFAK